MEEGRGTAAMLVSAGAFCCIITISCAVINSSTPVQQSLHVTAKPQYVRCCKTSVKTSCSPLSMHETGACRYLSQAMRSMQEECIWVDLEPAATAQLQMKMLIFLCLPS
jgi:hypothetical protein